MKTSHSDQLQRDCTYSEPPTACPGARRISVPAKTLLVVDDDPVLRGAETQFLRMQGYAVLEAGGAAEALRLARETGPIHLLITDFSMPEVDGLELTQQFRVVHPNTPVLMVSGSMPLLRDASEDLDRIELLAKPFTLNELLRKVRVLSDAAASLPRRKTWCCD